MIDRPRTAGEILASVGLTADEVLIAPGAMMMVHDPSGGCYGQAADMRRMAESLDGQDGIRRQA